MQSTQRTAPVTCSISASRAPSAVVTIVPLTFAATGNRGSASCSPASTRATSSCAGCISAQWKGALTGSITVRRAPLALQRAAAFSTAAVAPEITVCPGEFRFAAATVSPVSSRGLLAGLDHLHRIEGENRRHRPLSRGHGLLHRASARLHRAHGIGKRQCPRRHVRRPLTQRVSRGQRRLHAMFGKHAQCRHAHGQNGRLRVFGQLQVFFRPFKAKPRERKSAGLVGFGKRLFGNRETLGEIAAHAHGLRTLPRKEKCNLLIHSIEDCIPARLAGRVRFPECLFAQPALACERASQ